MNILSKKDFLDFINVLIEDTSVDVEGVMAKGERFVFGPLDSAEGLRLDYDLTILPPKKYFLPQYETMISFNLPELSLTKPAIWDKKRVIIGIHPYDLVAIGYMDKYYLDTDIDDIYLKRRKDTLLVGLMPVGISEKTFFGDFIHTIDSFPSLTFDLMLTDLGDEIAIVLGSEVGKDLLSKAPNLKEATQKEEEKVIEIQRKTIEKTSHKLKINLKGLYDLLIKNYNHEIWARYSKRCLGCGTCTLVCPTCFCYDVADEINLDLTTGERIRTWDSCLLRDFTKIGTGEIFREKIEDRYRHRFNRKWRYLPERLGFMACVGCGRCAKECIPDIADPVKLFNALIETTTQPVVESERFLSTPRTDVSTISERKPLYIPRQATIKRVDRLTEKETLFEIGLDDEKPLGHQPGQFVKVSIMGIGEAPISVSSPPDGETFELVIRKVGDVTSKLHTMVPGDKIGIRGPLGKGFDLETLRGRDLLFIGGGLGVVPLRSLFNHVLNNRKDYGAVTILYGCKEPVELLFKDEIASWKKRDDLQYMLTVDTCPEGESWEGEIGVITTIIPKVQFDPKETIAIVVGPPIMYRFVNRDLLRMGMPEENIIVSFERKMKCGVGKCGHCQINNVYVCKEGPVFNYKKIKDLPEAFS